MSLSMYEVLKTINQIVTDAKDNAPPNNKKIGLHREDYGEKIQDRRVIDGFSVKFSGNIMRICYSSSKQVRDVTDNFKNEVKDMIDNIVKYIKTCFKNETDTALKLKAVMDEPYLFVGVQGPTTAEARYSAYIDYKIENKTSEDPADVMLRFGTDKKKSLKNGKESLEKAIRNKF